MIALLGNFATIPGAEAEHDVIEIHGASMFSNPAVDVQDGQPNASNAWLAGREAALRGTYAQRRDAVRLIRRKRRAFLELASHLTDTTRPAHQWKRVRSNLIEAISVLLPYNERVEGPRLAEARRVFHEVEETSRKLRRLISELVQLEGQYGGGGPPESPLYRGEAQWEIMHRFLSADLHRTSLERNKNESALFDALFDVEEGCRLSLQHLPSDRGGAGNLERQVRGNVKAQLFGEAALLYGRYRYKRLTGSVPNPSKRTKGFYDFAAAFYEFVSGRNPYEEGGRLAQHVAFAAKLGREVVLIQRALDGEIRIRDDIPREMLLGIMDAKRRWLMEGPDSHRGSIRR